MLADGTRRRILATCALGAAPALATLAGAAFSPAAAAHAATTPDVRCVVWTAPSGDDTYLNSAIQGHNPQFDLVKGELDMSADGKTLKAFLTVSNLTLDTPPGLTAADWMMLWTFKDTRTGKDIIYFAEANIVDLLPGTNSATIQYKDGTYDPSTNLYSEESPKDTPDNGNTTPGANGVIEIDVPLVNIGNPLAFNVLTKVTGETLAEESVTRYPSDTRYVMDTGGPGKDYVLTQGCASSTSASGGHTSRATTARASGAGIGATVASHHASIASSQSSTPQRSSGSAVTATQLRGSALAGAAVGRSNAAGGAAALAGLLFGGIAIRRLRRRRPALQHR